MRLWRARNAIRVGLAVVLVGCVTAAVIGGSPWLFGAAALVAYTGLVIFELAARFRDRSEHAPVEALKLDGRGNARLLDTPWRSSPAWDSYDLSVSDSPGSDWFSDWFKFNALSGDALVVEAEAVVPGPGIEVRVFAPGDGAVPSATAVSDAKGNARVTLVADVGGMHLVHVRIAAQGFGTAQRYRMSVSGPSPGARRAVIRNLTSRFNDVPLWHPYHEAIQSLTEHGILSGITRTGNPTFAPDLPIWVAEFDNALRRSLAPGGADGGQAGAVGDTRTPTSLSATDDPGGHTLPRALAIQAIVEALERASPGMLEDPPSEFMSTFGGGPPEGEAYVAIADYNGLLSGVPRLGPQWDLTDPISRGEAAQLIHVAAQMVERPRSSNSRLAVPSNGRRAAPTTVLARPDVASDADLAASFVPGANEALDELMDDLVIADVPADAAPLEIDAAAMRVTIESVRARFDAQRRGSREGSEEDG